MRDVLTTALEVAGMLSISVAAGVQTQSSAVAWALSGVSLVAVGVLEGRKS
jgi:hypothetical protein